MTIILNARESKLVFTEGRLFKNGHVIANAWDTRNALSRIENERAKLLLITRGAA